MDCLNFLLVDPPEQLTFEISYPNNDRLSRESFIHLYMIITPEAQLNDIAFAEEDVFYVL